MWTSGGRVVHGEIEPVIEDAAFTRPGAGAAAARAVGCRHMVKWTEAVKKATGAKGRALFHPLRLALTGLERGPEN